MMARSTCSNQRPDTLMQDRICQVDETSCNARPDHTFGSHPEITHAKRGRDDHCSPPPAQIRAGGIPAHGSYLGCMTAKRLSGYG